MHVVLLSQGPAAAREKPGELACLSTIAYLTASPPSPEDTKGRTERRESKGMAREGIPQGGEVKQAPSFPRETLFLGPEMLLLRF